MSDLACENCGKDAKKGYCIACDTETNDYCAQLRKEVKHARVWSALWKRAAKQQRGMLEIVRMDRAFWQDINRKTYEKAKSTEIKNAELIDQRDKAQALVEEHERTIAERDARISALEAALQSLTNQVDEFNDAFDNIDWGDIAEYAASYDLNTEWVLHNQTDFGTLADALPDTEDAHKALEDHQQKDIPRDVSMRGGLEQLSASKMLHIPEDKEQKS